MLDRFDIVGLGCAAVDDLVYVDVYPPRDAKARINRTERQCGGLTATALVAAARLGSRCAYAGVLGNDELSRFVETSLQAEGIATGYVTRASNGGPVRSVIIVGEDRGSRNIFYDLAGAIGHAHDCPVPETLISRAKVLFIDHVDAERMLKPARLARSNGVAVIADIESHETPHIAELLELSDHLIVSRNIAGAITGIAEPAAAAAKLRRRDQVVIVTDGASGSWVVDEHKPDRPRHFPAFAVNSVDTTGCGDVFHGAYASGLASGMGLNDRVRFASAAAAIKATRRGGQAGIPDRAVLDRFLSHRCIDE